jgi:hypothetical protein
MQNDGSTHLVGVLHEAEVVSDKIFQFVCAFGHLSKKYFDHAQVKKGWFLASFVGMEGQSWFVPLESQPSTLLLDTVCCPGTAELRVIMAGCLGKLLSIICILLKAPLILTACKHCCAG